MNLAKHRGPAMVVALLPILAAGCGQNRFQQEVEKERSAVKLAREVQLGGYDLVTTDELKQLLDSNTDMLLVDSMPYEESYKQAHIAGARQFLFPKEIIDTWDDAQTDGKSQQEFAELLGPDRGKLIVVYCGFVKCARSHNAAVWARKLGYTNVWRYAGGIYAWKGAGHGTEAGP